MVENFGLYLKHERELRGVPLEEIAGATKIHIRFLKALEENHFEELPGEVFIKGYIRSYARTIGSDVDEVLNTYDQWIGKKQDNRVSEIPSEKDAQALADDKSFVGYLILGVLLLGLVGGGYFIGNKVFSGKTAGNKNLNQSTASIGQPAESQEGNEDHLLLDTQVKTNGPEEAVPGSPGEEVISSPSDSDLQDTGSNSSRAESDTVTVPPMAFQPDAGDRVSPPMEQQTPSSGERSRASEVSNVPASEAKPDGLILAIKVQQDSWFNMTIDDLREEDFILPAGTGKTFYGNDKFRITIGNRNGTVLVLNGKQLVLPQGSGNVVKDFIINHQNTE